MIHLFKFKKLNILLDIESGAVHIVSGIVYDMLSRKDKRGRFMLSCGEDERAQWDFEKKQFPKNLSAKYAKAEIAEAIDEVDALIAAGMLFANALPEEITSPENREPVIKAMCLHIAHDCNMRCAYCFAGTGEYSGERSMLSAETGRNAIDFLLTHSGSRQNLEIDFFGGEPLMNFDVVKELVRYGRAREKEFDKHIRFTLTTNGLLLDDEKTAFINEHMDNVILSIDGRREVNDRLRKTVSGHGTYERIIDKLIAFAKERERIGKLYYVRGTYTSYNKDFASDIEHLASLGFSNISVEPVVAPPDADYALTEDDIPELLAEYDKLTEIMIRRNDAGKPISFFHFNIDLSQGPCLYKRAAGCGAGTEYAAIAANGDIYPCHQFVGEKEFLRGNVNAAGAGVSETSPSCADGNAGFGVAHIYSKSDCRACWAKYWCSGGCHANATHMNGDIMKPYGIGCTLERKRLECAIALTASAI